MMNIDNDDDATGLDSWVRKRATELLLINFQRNTQDITPKLLDQTSLKFYSSSELNHLNPIWLADVDSFLGI